MAEQHNDRPAPAQHPAEHDGQHEPRTVAVVVTYNRRDFRGEAELGEPDAGGHRLGPDAPGRRGYRR